MKRSGFAQIPLMIGLLLMAIAVPVATKLVQDNQDTRNRAAGNECIYDSDCGTGYLCKQKLCVPKTVATATKAPATKAPATKAPATKAPATKAPATKAPAVVCKVGEKKCVGITAYWCKTDKSGWNTQACSYGCKDGACISAPTATKQPATPTLGAGSGAKCEAAGGRCLNFNSLASSVCGSNETKETKDCPVVNGYGSSVQGCCLPKSINPCSSNGCSTKGASATCTYTFSGQLVTGTHTCNLDVFSNCLTWSECKTSIGPTKTPPKACSSNGCSTLGKSEACSYTLIGIPGVPTGTKVTGTHTCNLDVFSNCLTWSECKAKYITPTLIPTKVPTLTPTKVPICTTGGLCKIASQPCCDGVSVTDASCPNTSKRCTGKVVVTLTPTKVPTPTSSVLKCYCADRCSTYECNWQTAKGGGFDISCNSTYCSAIPTPKVPALCTSVKGQFCSYPSCTTIGAEWGSGTCTGVTSFCCKPKVTPTPAPGCITGTSCLLTGKTCCSGYITSDSSCTGTSKRCAIAPTSRPPTGVAPTDDPRRPTVKPTLRPSINPTTPPTRCTQCSGKPGAKRKGDADCSGVTNMNDASIWRSEFIQGDLGTKNKKTWKADFDCNGKVNLNDVSIWRDNFIKSLEN